MVHRLADEKATPALPNEKAWKSVRYQMTSPVLLATLATNSLADDMSMEEEQTWGRPSPDSPQKKPTLPSP